METILVGVLGQSPYIDYILNQVEMIVNRGLKAAGGDGSNPQSAFVPEAPGPTTSGLTYVEEARTAEELRASSLVGQEEAAVPATPHARMRAADDVALANQGVVKSGTPKRSRAPSVPWM